MDVWRYGGVAVWWCGCIDLFLKINAFFFQFLKTPNQDTTFEPSKHPHDKTMLIYLAQAFHDKIVLQTSQLMGVKIVVVRHTVALRYERIV
jgi:hypothetical protein